MRDEYGKGGKDPAFSEDGGKEMKLLSITVSQEMQVSLNGIRNIRTMMYLVRKQINFRQEHIN